MRFRIFQKSDSEIIEEARKTVRLSKKWGRWVVVLQLVFAATCFVVSCWIVQFGLQLANQVRNVPGQPAIPGGAGFGLSIGITVGIAAGVFLMKGVEQLILGIGFFARFDRISRLLLTYDDTVSYLLADNGRCEPFASDQSDVKVFLERRFLEHEVEL